MKESDITPEIQAKAKELAKHWRMETYEGCWVLQKEINRLQLITGVPIKINEELGFFYDEISRRHRIDSLDLLIPIPSISDCERRLEDLGWAYDSRRIFPSNKARIQIHTIPTFDTPQLSKQIFIEKTTHEALLSALLEVVKE